jgi:hypothetical protein
MVTTATPPQAPPQQQDDQQLTVAVATVLAGAATVAAASASLWPVFSATGFTSQPAVQGALQVVMSMPPDQYGVAGPASLNMARLNLLRRAQFAVSAARRITAALVSAQSRGQGLTDAFRTAVASERRYYGQHLAALWGRAKAAAQVDTAAASHGRLLGWNMVTGPNTSPECLAAGRRNFLADQMPLIGYPGAVHPGCRCWPGRPWPGAGILASAGRRAA